MGRSAKQLDLPDPWSSPVREGARAFLGLISRNPTLAGGSTAFLVALSFVSANALWYQPYAHSGAFFATREFVRTGAPEAQPETTTIRIVAARTGAGAGQERSGGRRGAGDAEGPEFLRRRDRRPCRAGHPRRDRSLSGEDGHDGHREGRRPPSRPVGRLTGHCGHRAKPGPARTPGEDGKRKRRPRRRPRCPPSGSSEYRRG